MVSQSDALILLLQALAAMRDAGYSDDDVVDLVKDAWDHLEGGGQRPHAVGHCTECGRVIVGWSAHQWAILVREPCRHCGQPW